MPSQGPLRWLDGEGWIVLSGGGDVGLEEEGSDVFFLDARRLAAEIQVQLSE